MPSPLASAGRNKTLQPKRISGEYSFKIDLTARQHRQTDPWYQDPLHPFVKSLESAAQRVPGHEVEIIGRSGGIDSRFARHFGMAAACPGPKAANIHGTDGSVEIGSVVEATKVLGMAVLEWCGREK